MIKVGATDVFERVYMQKFRVLAGKFGEFVIYERDRGARDLGLHLTRRLSSGEERLSSALCWFQMKGLMTSTLPRNEFKKAKEVKVVLKVLHLRYWYLQPMPTYLVVYVESADTFLILNIQEYVAQRWGKSILDLKQKTATVHVPSDSLLDEQAFNLILIKTDIEEWIKALETDEESARLCRRDYDLIWHLGTADEREVEHQAVLWDWQSKLRSQFFIQERSSKTQKNWSNIREHWQFATNIFNLEDSYPYIDFYSQDDDSDDLWDEEDYYEVPMEVLKNGDMVAGVNFCDEYFEYIFGARLNELGARLFDFVATLEKIGLIEITPGQGDWLSIAPWHHRAV